jgi:hypothetical protein
VSSRPKDQGLRAAILMKRSWRALAGLGGCMALLLTAGLLAPTLATAATGARAVTAAPAGDGPPGFWWGTDSFPVTVPGSAPYRHLPVRLVPGSRCRAVRAVLRRSDQRQPVRADVAVVRWRRGHQWHRRLQRRPRHDRRHQAELNRAGSLPATGTSWIPASGNARRGPGHHPGVDGLVPARGGRAT